MAGTLHLAGVAGPLLLVLAPQSGSTRGRRSSTPPSGIDVVIAAYLEASVIGATVRRLRSELDDHGGGRIIVVASDPATHEAAEGADVRLLRPREGKARAINAGVQHARGELLVLTDANCTIEPPEWPRLVTERLAGGVGLLSANKTEEDGEGLYWSYEAVVKRIASERGGSLAVVGEFIALRREDFRDLPDDEVNDDLWMAVEMAVGGGRVEVDGRITTVEAGVSPSEQWGRRLRIMDGQLRLMWRRRRNLLRTSSGRNLLLHKGYRSTVGAASFWVGAATVTALLPRLARLPVLVSVVVVLHRYAVTAGRATALDPLVSYVGMQAVPVEVARRAVVRRLARTDHAPARHLWSKVPR